MSFNFDDDEEEGDEEEEKEDKKEEEPESQTHDSTRKRFGDYLLSHGSVSTVGISVHNRMLCPDVDDMVVIFLKCNMYIFN